MSAREPAPELIRQTCVAQGLRRAARLVSQRYDAALAPHGLTIGQFSVLAALWGREPVPVGRLAGALGMDRTTLTRVLGPLRTRGLVQFVTAGGDRRARPVGLTASGEELARRAARAWETAQEATLGRLPEDRWPDLRDALHRLG